jgi:hypothetical protein
MLDGALFQACVIDTSNGVPISIATIHKQTLTTAPTRTPPIFNLTATETASLPGCCDCS